MDVLHRLGRLPVQALQRGGAEAQAVFPDDLPGLGAGGRVRRRRAGGDHIQRVAHDVRQDHRLHPRRGAPPGEPPTLYGGQPLADGVHLDDVRPAGQELVGDILKLLRRDQRLLEQRAPAAGEQEENRVLRLQTTGHFQDIPGAAKAPLVRHRVSRLAAYDAGDLAHNVAVFGQHDPAPEGPVQIPDGCGGHLPPGLAHGCQIEVLRQADLRQRPAHRRVRTDCVDGRSDHRLRVPPQYLVHPLHLSLSALRLRRYGAPPYYDTRRVFLQAVSVKSTAAGRVEGLANGRSVPFPPVFVHSPI